ncbi:hypothetical protein SAMN05443245_6928 [Paraburkholderia fungorum]|uniref:Uncharacterized protein n=1 Tax=Paraburkholderia fungorum TaxID=134537 RepID=A0A1H1JN71_9BURK|nr:hypothetical protein SAMN05443245_6928 [Paraburkholderia fungorum]
MLKTVSTAVLDIAYLRRGHLLTVCRKDENGTCSAIGAGKCPRIFA